MPAGQGKPLSLFTRSRRLRNALFPSTLHLHSRYKRCHEERAAGRINSVAACGDFGQLLFVEMCAIYLHWSLTEPSIRVLYIYTLAACATMSAPCWYTRIARQQHDASYPATERRLHPFTNGRSGYALVIYPNKTRCPACGRPALYATGYTQQERELWRPSFVRVLPERYMARRRDSGGASAH